MAHDSLEVVRAGYEAFQRGDLDAVFANYAPDIEWHTARGTPMNGEVLRGAAEIRSLFDDWAETFERFTIEVEDLRAQGDQVFAMVRLRGVGKGSAIEADLPFAQVVTVRNGKQVRIRDYLDRKEALEAAGLPKQSPPEPGASWSSDRADR